MVPAARWSLAWFTVACPGVQVYSPLELLLFIAGCCTIAESFVPQLLNVPKVRGWPVVRATGGGATCTSGKR
jgi:hypothetical protein